MSAVAEVTTARERLIQELREYRGMQESAATQADSKSLNMAARIVALYENRDLDGNPLERRWQDELPAPRPSRRRGVTDPNSFARFTKWAGDVTGLERSRLIRLKRAHGLASTVVRARTTVRPTGEWSLHPLNFLVTAGKEADIPKVWDAAVQLAQDDGRDAPSNTHVKLALKDWKDANLPKPVAGVASVRPKGAPAKVRRLEQEARRWVAQEPTLTVPMLRRVLADFEAKAAATPPVEEW